MIEIKTAGEFNAFLQIASRGDRVIYHRGYLPHDAMREQATLDLKCATQLASERGIAMLTQRKLGHMDYEYLATRC